MSGLFHAGGEVSQNKGPANAPLNLANVRNSPQWVKVGNGLLYTLFSAAATTKSQTLFALPGGMAIHGMKVKHSVAFVGASVTACTLQVGITGTTNKYLSAFDCVPAVADTTFGVNFNTGTEAHAASTNILILATATGANLSVLSAGKVDIWALLSRMDG